MAFTRNGPTDIRNNLLSSLPKAELEALRPRLIRLQFVHGQVLHEYGEWIEQVLFIEQGTISLVADVDGDGVEVGVVGREGAVGILAALDPCAIAFNCAMVQIPGHGLRVHASDLRDVVAGSPALRDELGRSLQLVLAQSSQTAACNSRHTLTERLAQRLLTVHDRVDGDELPLTQESMAVMLAVCRPGVTVAVGALQQAGLIQQGRGHVTILDHAGLEQAACDCRSRVRAFAEAL